MHTTAHLLNTIWFAFINYRRGSYFAIYIDIYNSLFATIVLCEQMKWKTIIQYQCSFIYMYNIYWSTPDGIQ